MIKDHDLMRRVGFLVVAAMAVLATGCTKPNPRSCADGTCTDPAFPFCDVDGTLGETTNTCIAVACTPDAFEACRGDQAITCNATGNDFDLIQCERGCDDASGGCRLCDPNETACTNGTVATCDANGAVVSTEPCPLGCFEAEPRCREIDPSNGLAKFLDMVADPPDLDLTGDAFINTSTGELGKIGGSLLTIPNFFVPAPEGGAAVRVFVVRDARLGNVQVTGSSTASVNDTAPALAVIARGDIVIDGSLSIGPLSVQSYAATAGGVIFASCRGGVGRVNRFGSCDTFAGAGGGGHATTGTKGGDFGTLLLGGKGGGASGNGTLVPLRGGCASESAVSGGGAVQLSSQTHIAINGTVDVRGGRADFDLTVVMGGGAGGGILLEAPTVELGPDAKLLATGGAGAAGSGVSTLSETAAPSIGAQCTPPSSLCGSGGNGAGVGTNATPGMDAMLDSSMPIATSGGGGGGLGFVRLNTATGEYTKSSSTVEAAALSTGTLATR